MADFKAPVPLILNGKNFTVADGIVKLNGGTPVADFKPPEPVIFDGVGFGIVDDIVVSYGEPPADKPYVEETYDADYNLTSARLYGHQNIRNYMFRNAPQLTEVYVKESQTPITIGTAWFDNCSNVAHIYFECANSDVANIGDAPWGAPSTVDIQWNWEG